MNVRPTRGSLRYAFHGPAEKEAEDRAVNRGADA